jgi:uncharacterized protein involved in outer membrane biogenesis
VTRGRIFWLSLVAALALTIVMAGAAAVYFLPQVARQLVVTAIEASTGRDVTIDRVDVDVSTGRFSVRGFRLGDRDFPEPLATFDRLDGRLYRRALLRLQIRLEYLTLVNPTVHIVRTGPGTFNISDLLGGRGSSPRDITIDHFVISGGTAVLDDRVIVPARTWKSEHITLEARNVATLRDGGTAIASTIVQGAPVTLSVENLRLYPVHLRAQITLAVADLSLIRLYLPPAAPLALERGLASAGISLVHDAREGTRVSMGARLTDVVLSRRGQDVPFFTSPELAVSVNDLVMKDGAVALARAEVDGDATVMDGGVAPPARFHLTRLRLTAGDVTWPATQPGRVGLAATLGGGGALDASGTVRAAPRSAQLDVRLTSVPFAPFARYLPLAGHIDGLTSARAAIVVTFDAPFAVRATGTASLQSVTLEDDTRTDPDRPRVAVARATATGIEYEWPARARVGRLHLVKPSVVLERDAQGEFPLRGLFTRRRPPPDSGGAAPPQSRAPTDVVIGELIVEDAAITAIDRAMSPPHRVALAGTSLSVRDAAWPARSPATVRLSTPLPGGGELLAEGSVKLDPQEGQLRVRLRGADVAQAQPYLPVAARVRGRAGGDVTVAGTLTPLQLTVRGDASVDDVAVADGSRTLLGAEHAEAKGIDLQWPGRLAIDRLHVRTPRTVIERDRHGVLSLQTLLTPRGAAASVRPPAEAAAPAPPALALSIRDTIVEDAVTVVVDESVQPAARFEIPRARLAMQNFAWPSTQRARVQLTASLPAGGEMDAAGTFAAERARVSVKVTLRSADVTAVQPYLPIVGRVAGKADAAVTVAGTLNPLRMRVRGDASVAGLVVADRDRPLLTMQRAAVTGIDARWPDRVAIDRIHVTKPWAAVERNRRGVFSLRALFERPAAPRPGTPATRTVPVTLPAVSVRDILFEDGSTSVVDASVRPAARFEIPRARLAMQDVAWPSRTPARLQVSATLPVSGELDASGTFQVEPSRMDLKVTLKGVALAPARPYVPIRARFQGKLDADATLTGAFDRSALTIRGTASVSSFELRDANRAVITVERALIEEVVFEYPQQYLSVARIDVRRPWSLVERNAEGRFALVRLLSRRARPGQAVPPPPPGAPPTDESAEPTASPFDDLRVDIARIVVTDGFGRFVDRTTTPDFAEELSQLSLTVEELSTNGPRPARASLKGRIGPEAALSIEGRFGALDGPRFVDLSASLRDFAVPRANPYIDRLVGWTATQGRLRFDVRYRLEGDELDATNQVGVEGLDVEITDPPHPVLRDIGLPLNLVVSLLKDRRGDIQVSIPVRGSLASPEFDFGDAMWGAVRNLTIRLIALPFSLVGKLFFSEDSRIEAVSINPVAFEPGTATPPPAMAEHLGKVGVFLRETPAIRVLMRPVVTVADVASLRRSKVMEEVTKLASATSGPAFDAAVLRLFAERFPARKAPDTTDEALAVLIRTTPAPDAAAQALAAARTAHTAAVIVKAGVEPARVRAVEGVAAVEAVGAGRVEFEIVR